MGFYIQGGSASQESDYGFTNFTASDGGTADTTSPSTPVNLSVNIISPSQIVLSWGTSTDNVAVVGYHVFRNGKQIATTTSASFADTTVVPGVQYTYTVSAFDAAGNTSAQSSPVSAETSSASDITPPSVAANLKCSNLTLTTLTLIYSQNELTMFCRRISNIPQWYSAGGDHGDDELCRQRLSRFDKLCVHG